MSEDDDCDWSPGLCSGSSSDNDFSDNGADSDDNTVAETSRWNIFKAVSMYHVMESVRLFGPLFNSSWESLERQHAEVTRLFLAPGGLAFNISDLTLNMHICAILHVEMTLFRVLHAQNRTSIQNAY